jgi:hypothetical protein
MILRGLAGVLIGLAYGLLVGFVVFLLTRIGLDRNSSSSLMLIDPVGLAWLATVIAALITGICGALVGLIVGLVGCDKRKAAKVGFISGLIVLGLLLISSLSLESLVPHSLSDVIGRLVMVAVLPFGIALMSMLVAIVGAQLKPYDL